MYPNIGSSTPQPSAPPGTQSTTATTTTATTAASLTNSNAANLVGFSSLMSQPNNQNTPYPTGSTSQSMYPGQHPPSQSPYPPGQGQQPPYPTGPQSFPHANPYPANNPRAPGPPNSSGYSPYTPPQFAAGAPSQGAGYQANPHPPSASNPYQASNPPAGSQQGYSGYQQPPPPGQGSSPYPPPPSNPYQASNPPAGGQQGYSGYQQPPPGQGQSPYPPANPYQPQGGNASNQNPYRPANPYGSTQGYPNPSQPANPYSQQPGGYPQQHQPPPSQHQSQNPYPPPPQGGGYGGYPPYQQPPPPQQQPYQTPYGQQPPGGGYNANNYGAPATNDRLRAIAGRHEINDALAQRLNILQQFELVVLCDDSGSMNAPVDGTQGTRWDELRAIVQIIIEIGVIFDSNGVDVHFLNRAPMLNVTDPRQVVESFSQRPAGFTPLTASLRRIFQSAASKPNSDKRLLVFIATDGAPTDANGQTDIQGLENLMRNERQANTTYVTFLACTDDEASVAYLSQWDRTMMNVDVVDDYKTEREEVRRVRGYNYNFSFGDYVVKALLGAVDPQMDMLDEQGNNNNQYSNPNSNNNNFRRY